MRMLRKNQIFKTLNAVVDNLCDTVLAISANKNSIKSIIHRNWIDAQFLI